MPERSSLARNIVGILNEMKVPKDKAIEVLGEVLQILIKK